MAPLSAELAVRRHRVRRIRRRVVAGASVLFAVLTAAIAVQLSTGHDPALASTAKAQAATVPNPAMPNPAMPSSPGSDDSAGSPLGQVAPLTTGQS